MSVDKFLWTYAISWTETIAAGTDEQHRLDYGQVFVFTDEATANERRYKAERDPSLWLPTVGHTPEVSDVHRILIGVKDEPK